MKKLRLISVLLLAALSAALLCGCARTQPSLRVWFFSAGKADAVLLTTDHGAVLIDAGEKGFGKEILSCCREQGISSLDYLILTHFDQDHIGGVPRVLQGLPVGKLLQTCLPGEGAAYERYLESLETLRIEPVTLQREFRFELDGVRFTVSPPQKTYSGSPSNNSSLIVSVQCGDCSMLFLGDAENARLRDWQSENPKARCDFVKLPHHGAWHKALEALLEQLRPSSALITCSEDAPESERTMGLLDQLGTEVFLTRKGPVILECDGRSLSLHYAEG